jgi:hypothetical protein
MKDNINSTNDNNARQLERNMSILVSEAGQPQSANDNLKIRRNSSLLNFKSLDISLKSLYTSLKNQKNSNEKKRETKNAPTLKVESADGNLLFQTEEIFRSPKKYVSLNNRLPSILFPEKNAGPLDESEKLLLTYTQSPVSHHRRSFDTTSSQYLSTQTNYQEISSQVSSPYLSVSAGNIRRSSTSDILMGAQPPPAKPEEIRTSSSKLHLAGKPSTKEVLRKARERKGSECKMGRSTSQGGIARGGMRNRRTSMAF